MHKPDSLVAGAVTKNPVNMQSSADAGVNALHTDIEAVEPFDDMTGPMGDPIPERTLGDAPETMPKIRIQVEPVTVKALPVRPPLPAVPDFYMALYTLTTESGVTFWTMGDGDKDLESIRKRYGDRANLRILRIPGGAA